MKDKEKQISKNKEINDLANTLYNRQDKYDLSNPFEVAKCVIDLGYRKLPEDSVVLSREEYEKLKNENKTLLDSAKMMVVCFCDQQKIKEQASKETAEKIFNEFYAELKEFGQGRVITYASVCEIAKKHNITIPRETFTSIEIKE